MFGSLNNFSATKATVTEEKSAAGEYLIFVLGAEKYGIDFLKVQEIRGYDAVTQIANTPDFIKGVVNLRGKIVPMIDLRIKFELGKVEYDECTVVIVLNLNGRVVCILVDGVSDVIAIQDNQIRDACDSVASMDTQYIIGSVKLQSQMLILLDIEQLINS